MAYSMNLVLTLSLVTLVIGWKTQQPEPAPANPYGGAAPAEQKTSASADDYIQTSTSTAGYGQTEKAKSYEAPSTTQKAYDIPSTQKAYDIPSTQKAYDMPSTQKAYDIPSTQKAYEAPSTQKAYEAPSTQKGYDAPSTQKDYEAPTTQKGYDVPSTQKAYDAPSTQKGYEAPTTLGSILYGSTSTIASSPSVSPAAGWGMAGKYASKSPYIQGEYEIKVITIRCLTKLPSSTPQNLPYGPTSTQPSAYGQTTQQNSAYGASTTVEQPMMTTEDGILKAIPLCPPGTYLAP